MTTIWLFPQEESTTTERPLASPSSEPAIEHQKVIAFPIKIAKAASQDKKAEPETEQAADAHEQEAQLDADLEPEANKANIFPGLSEVPGP